MILTTEKHIPPYIFEYVDFDGRVDIDRLVTAVGRVGAIVPETLYRLDSRRLRFKEAGFTPRDVVIEEDHALDCGPTWDLRHDTQVKIHIIHGPDADSMVMGMSHYLSDGAGVMQYTTLLGEGYQGECPDVHNNRSSQAIVAASKFDPPTQGETRSRQFPPMALPIPHTGTDHFCRHITLPQSTMKTLRDVAKSHSLSLNDVFLAASARVACRMMDMTTMPMRCPVNLRPFIDAGPLTVANMTGLYAMTVDVDPGDSFSTTAQRVHQEVAASRERGRHFFDMPTLVGLTRRYPIGMLRRSMAKTYRVRPVEYTNIGVLPPLVFGNVNAVSAYMTGAYGAYPEVPISISGFSGLTTFATTIEGDSARADAAEDVVRLIIGEFGDWLAEDGSAGGCRTPSARGV